MAMAELERLYAAIDDDAAFDAMPEVLARLCGGRSAAVTRIDAQGALSYARMSYFRAEDCAAYYSDGWVHNDPWAIVGDISPGRACLADAVLPPEKFRETAMYNELFRSLGDDTARCVGIVSASSRDVLVLGIHRPGAAAAFTPKNAALLDSAMLHLRRVFRSRDAIRHAEAESGLSAAMLDKSGKAMMLVDATLRVRRVTDSATTLVDRADGIRYVAGRLALEDVRAHQSLLAAVRGAVNRIADTPGVLLCPRPSTQLSYRIVVLPAGNHAPGSALVILDDPAARPGEDRFRRLAQAYSLTPAEAALAKGLAEDRALDEIAAARGVTKETIRTQLKSLFLKTGVRRQIDLLKLIIQMP
jgi:DNA-binding CsgD family transcriptional regulator